MLAAAAVNGVKKKGGGRGAAFPRPPPPPPLRYAPEIYPPMTKFPETWAISYKTTDGKRRSRAVIRMLFPYVARSLSLIHISEPTRPY